MGLYYGNTQVDMFSIMRRQPSIRAVFELPDLATLTDADVNHTYCLIYDPSGASTYIVGHIYQVVKIDGNLSYKDLNENGGGISATYDPMTMEMITNG